MDTLHFVFLAGLVVLSVALGWALVGRARAETGWQAASKEGDQVRGQQTEAEKQRDAERTRRETEVGEWRSKHQSLEVKAAQMSEQIDAAAAMHVEEIEQARELAAEQVRAAQQRIDDFKVEVSARDAKRDEEMKAAFAAMSSKQLGEATKEFLKLASERMTTQQQAGAAELEKRKAEVENFLKPIGEALKRTDEKLGAIETRWAGDRAGLLEQMKAIGVASESLRGETGKLVRALREPHVRGRYGEIQLKRVAELAGMANYCDFFTQEQCLDGDGNPLRPDMVVRMPSERVVVVDAKTNIQAYLDALEAATPELAEESLDRFAGHVANQATALAKKKYWKEYSGSPEFVVMFIPGDQFIDAALSRRPDLLEHAATQNVLLASPSTLIGLLRAVAVGYQEQRLAREAETLRELGKELLARAATAFEHALKVGANLERAVKTYNEFVASYTGRLEPTLRKFDDSGVRSGREVTELKPIEVLPRQVVQAASELPLLDSATS